MSWESFWFVSALSWTGVCVHKYWQGVNHCLYCSYGSRCLPERFWFFSRWRCPVSCTLWESWTLLGLVRAPLTSVFLPTVSFVYFWHWTLCPMNCVTVSPVNISNDDGPMARHSPYYFQSLASFLHLAFRMMYITDRVINWILTVIYRIVGEIDFPSISYCSSGFIVIPPLPYPLARLGLFGASSLLSNACITSVASSLSHGSHKPRTAVSRANWSTIWSLAFMHAVL